MTLKLTILVYVNALFSGIFERWSMKLNTKRKAVLTDPHGIFCHRHHRHILSLQLCCTMGSDGGIHFTKDINMICIWRDSIVSRIFVLHVNV